MMPTVFIYALKDPDTGQIRYVGKAANLKNRIRDHLRGRGKGYRANWIRSLLVRGLKPVLEVVDEIPEVDWRSWEAAYIEYFRELGCCLVNGTNGGDGPDRGKTNPWFGRNMSGANNPMFGISRTGEAAAHFGHTHSLETKAKMSAAKWNKKNSRNTSGLVGVCWDKSRDSWMACASICGGKRKLIGRFDKIEDAVFVRNLWLDFMGI